VAIKVQRPNLVARISEDIAIVRRLARWMASSKRLFKGNDWVGMIDEFERTIYAELDYRNEGRNAERFRRNFADWPRVYVPTIFWEQTTSRVITMEFLRGIRVTDLEGLAAAGIGAKEANELMHRTYFKQLLEDGFFHADPHPGNILILHDGRLAFFDFGMVGHISPTLQSQMVSAFFHLIERDAPGIVQDLIGLGFLSPEADREEFARVVEDLFRRKLDVNLSEVRFKDLTYELGDIIYRYPFSTPASFTFIIRALMTLEGISITMNPRFNFLEVALPYARDFLFRRESAQLREKVWASLHDARNGKLNWTRVWNLARTALALYFA
jgi:Predicted unusual protein kinase